MMTEQTDNERWRRFIWEPDDIEITMLGKQCPKCKPYNGDHTCSAFPDEIPREIALSKFDHQEPYPGDDGIRFDPKNY